MMQKGNIGVTTENIFPVIKKFLYSDHEIFLREMVSNAVDATQKIKTLAEKGDFKGELGELKVSVSVNEKKGTITISDNGIGMTEEEIDKYINQIASPVSATSWTNTRITPMLLSVISDSVSILPSWFPRKWKSSPRVIKMTPRP